MSLAIRYPDYRWFQCRTTYIPEDGSIKIGIYGSKFPKDQKPSGHDRPGKWELLESKIFNDTLSGSIARLRHRFLLLRNALVRGRGKKQ
jgi:hypothetical protein